MGLFGTNPENAGVGIAKNARRKKGFFLYWEIFGRKFWQLLELNIEYFCFFLPLVGAALVFLSNAISTNVKIILIALLAVVFVVCIGPATAGFTKILKNFYVEKPTFIVHDFFRTFKNEFKHALPIGIIDCFIFCSVVAALFVYPRLLNQQSSVVYYIFLIVPLSVGIIALLMNFYVFLMMTTTTLSLKNVLKNSLALGIVALKKNVITVLILAAVIAFYALILYFLPLQYAMILLFSLPFFPAAWLGLVIVVQCYPLIQKYIINPYYEKRGEVNPEMERLMGSKEAIFEDMGGKEKPIEAEKKPSRKQSAAPKGHKGKIIS